MRIEMAHQHARDAAFAESVRAGRRAAEVATRLERDRECRATQRARTVASRCRFERNDLRVRSARRLRSATTEHAIAAKHDRADGGIREGTTRRAPRLRERRPHRGFGIQADGRRGGSGARTAGGSSLAKGGRRAAAASKNAA